MKRFLIVLMVLVMMLSLAACGKGESIVGKWTFGATEIEFKEDSAVLISINKTLNYDGTYALEGDKVTITVKEITGALSEEFTYSLENGVLTMTGDITLKGAAPITMTFVKEEEVAESAKKAEGVSGLLSSLIPNKEKDKVTAEDSTAEDKKEEKGFLSGLFSFLKPAKKEEEAAVETPVHTHEFSKATCTEDAKCVCGEIEKAATGHTYVEGVCSVCKEKDPNFDKSIRQGYVKINRVRVRSGPGTHASVVLHNKAEIQLNTWHPVNVHGGKIPSDDPKYPDWYSVSFIFNGIGYEGYMFSDYVDIPAAEEEHEHIYSSKVVKEPTCAAEGERKYSCAACDREYTEIIGKINGHTWEAATCTSPKTCSECGKKEGSALGHSFYDGICYECGAVQP
ncbi:MAG: hypothetical protein IJN42_05300 [Clostridia bacterium]|nr:hypothetical protein [Clostridia bacterium]